MTTCCQRRFEASERGVDILWDARTEEFWLHHEDHGDIVTVDRCPWCGKPLEIDEENEDPLEAPLFKAGDVVGRVMNGRTDTGEEGIILDDDGALSVQWMGEEAYNESVEEAGPLGLLQRPLSDLDVETMVGRARQHLEEFCKRSNPVETKAGNVVRLFPRSV